MCQRMLCKAMMIEVAMMGVAGWMDGWDGIWDGLGKHCLAGWLPGWAGLAGWLG